MLKLRSILIVAVAAALTLAACGGSSKSTSTSPGGTSAGKVNPADCGLAAFAKATKPVEVTF